MSVISFDKDSEVWEASSSLIYSMLEYMIGEVGEKQYLVQFMKNYDNMYNSIGLEDVNMEQLCEFHRLVQSYVANREYESESDDQGVREAMRDNLSRLVEMIDSSIAKRRLADAVNTDYPDLPNWTFNVDEVSAGLYEVTGRDKQGHIVSATGTDVDRVMEKCRQDASRLGKNKNTTERGD